MKGTEKQVSYAKDIATKANAFFAEFMPGLKADIAEKLEKTLAKEAANGKPSKFAPLYRQQLVEIEKLEAIFNGDDAVAIIENKLDSLMLECAIEGKSMETPEAAFASMVVRHVNKNIPA